MPKPKSLSNLFRAAFKTTNTSTASAGDRTRESFITNLESKTHSKKPHKPKTSSESEKQPKAKVKPQPPPSPAVNSSSHALKLEDSDFEESVANPTMQDITKIINDGVKINTPDSEEAEDEELVKKALEIPWLSRLKNNNIGMLRKDVSRERKQKWVFTYSQVNHINRIVDTCADKLGTDNAMEVFGKLGRETGLKEFNALMKKYIEQCRETDDESVAMKHISAVLQLFKSMKEQGFSIEEETYGPFLILLIDKAMVEEFNFFSDIIKDTNPSKNARLGYYDMLLYIGVNDEEKIQELCNYICIDDGDNNMSLRENYLLALCESDQKNYLLQLLETMDITKFSSLDHLASIFKSLGRLSLESFAKKFLLVLKSCDYGAEDISTLIFCYATSFPNLVAEDVVSKFKTLHTIMKMSPSSTSYEKLVVYNCTLLKVHLALDIVDQMCKEGLTISINTIHSILNASEESFDFNLVRRIYSLIYHLDLTPNNETFRSMISLSVKMKDFEGAYGLLDDLKKLNLAPTASMYNAIMGGYFREKNIRGALMVLKQMKLADVKPDSSSYSYLISNCNNEEEIIKYYEEMKVAGIQLSKQIFMALINAYTTCGQFEKAKQVLLDKEIPIKHLNEIRSVLVSALASHGQMTDALNVYEEIKQAGSNLEPRAVISLIEHVDSEGEQSRLLKLLEELDDPNYWVDGCFRVILYCIRNKDLRSAVDLLKQLKDRFSDDELAMEVLFDEVFSEVAETEPADVQIGMDLLQAIKDELGASPSRKCLDFLLTACVTAKDLGNSLLVWKEYQAAGLPYNVTSYLRMYQALLASGGHVSAKVLLNKIPKDDPHVRIVIQECQRTYIGHTSLKGEKKRIKEEGRRKRSA
ncbi:PREDICTED: pentatricopeptide repeat-containing protein At4g04790, mitochondrial-like [Populus euphratica]|uniref:Pentatricopeptide repeat-containing protein At4g04790, mitochondrial-like n=1 Tax=Populus euphratica TaxID=75702 RepID=A0AAJ6VJI9_POPEU|nr:PREDICTED: pentatricopeptide repeat-containing protein At4g04790, mitochondrial-like [Populus euphratica]